MALFIGRIPRGMNNRDLEDTFTHFGKISRLDVKKGFGFVEFDDKRDAEDALKSINGKGELVVEWAKNGGKRPGENECFFCGKEGHWARDCPDSGRERGGGRFGGGRGGRNKSPRRDGGRGSDRRDRDYDRRRDDRGDRGDRGGRDRSPRRDYRSERDYDRRDNRRDDRRGGDRRDDRRDGGRYDERRDEKRDDRNGGRNSDQGDYGKEDLPRREENQQE